jgi:FO synthase
VLAGGVNDLGGTLMEETISRMAGSQNGSFKTISQLADMVAPTGRELRQRTTLYQDPSAERLAAARASDGVCASVRGNSPTDLQLLTRPRESAVADSANATTGVNVVTTTAVSLRS